MINLSNLIRESKETVDYVAYMEHRGKIITYYGNDIIKTPHGFQGTIYEYMYINKYPNKQKGWVKTIFKNGKYFGNTKDTRIQWIKGTTTLNIKAVNESR